MTSQTNEIFDVANDLGTESKNVSNTVFEDVLSNMTIGGFNMGAKVIVSPGFRSHLHRCQNCDLYTISIT